MDKEKMNLLYSSKIEQITAINSSFDKGVMRIFYLGKNRNNSFISREALERSEATLDYCPIVVNYDVEEDSFGGHDVELIHTENGLRLLNVTNPVGVVPAGAKHWFETIEDDSGAHEYFCSEVLLWKRQPAYQKILADGITAQSMEININDGCMEDGVYVIRDFEFTALTLLNGIEDVPCFESAGLQVFTMDEFKQQYTMMMEECKRDYADIQTAFAADADTSTKGGTEILDEKMELVKEFNIDVAALDIDISQYTVEELREKFTALQAEEQSAQDFSLTAQQLCSEIRSALESTKVETEYGSYCRYWYMDHTDEEVFFEDCTDWRIYGAAYAMNGDNVVIDFETKKRKKCAFVDFDEGEETFSMADAVNAVLEDSAKKFAAEVDQCKQAYADLENEVQKLRQYKEDRVAEDRALAENELFTRFAELAGVAEFDALKDNCGEISIEELEDKCYALLGRQKATFSVQTPTQTKLPVEHQDQDKEPYGGLFVKYLKQ